MICAAGIISTGLLYAVGAMADGTETLGPPSIKIAAGTGIVAAGVGLAEQATDTITIEVPIGASVKQVLVYWEGFMATDVVGPDTITVDGGNTVTGTLIGGQTFFFSGAYSSAYRADITDLKLVSPGSNSLTIASPGYTDVSNGAGVVVIYDDGSASSDIALRDGVDLAFVNFPEPRKSTIAQTFTFSSATTTRVANLAMFFSSVAGTISGADSERPSSVEVTVSDGTTILSNVLASLDGEEWDTLNLPIEIPAGATELTVQAFSQDNLNTGNLPASLVWSAAALSVPPVTAAIGDTVWQDLNTNGLQDEGEPGVIDVTVNLLENPDGDADCSSTDETVIATDVTDSGGKYLFDGLDAGDYCVEFVRPDGFIFTEQNVGTDDTIDSDPNRSTGRTANISLDAGETDLTWDAGLIESDTAIIGDFVWEDCNGNGIQDDGGDPVNCPRGAGIPGVPVVLTEAGPDGVCNSRDDVTVGSTSTGANGFYLFEGLTPNVDYCVTFPKPGNSVGALDCGAADVAYTVKGLDPASGVDSNANPDGSTDSVSLGAGESNLTIDAGLFCLASIGDTLWEDSNRDGIQNNLNGTGGEPGRNGVTVTLLRYEAVDCTGDPDQVDQTTTGPAPLGAELPQIPDGAGWYQFDGLAPGCYIVRFDKPAGSIFSARYQPTGDPNDIQLPEMDSNVDPNGITENIKLLSGVSDQTIDAGINFPVAGLGDFVFEDRDADGIQDSGEPGIQGVSVFLLDPGANEVCESGDLVLDSTTTGAAGEYSFTDLNSGDYCVEFDKGTVACEFGDAQFSPQEQGGDPAKDSNPDPMTGVSGVVDLLPGEFDETIDAGIYCPAALGDRVWIDLDPDGIQDCSDTNNSGIIGDVVNGVPDAGPECDQAGVADVPVELLDADCSSSLGTTTTDGDGFYFFEGLTPGDQGYCVKWTRPAFTECTLPNQGADPAVDSDGTPVPASDLCETTETITLVSDSFDPNWDLGVVKTPPACDLLLDKQCRVETPPPPVFTEKCDGAIQEFTMVWYGDQPVRIQAVEKLASTSPALGTVINPGDVVVFVPDGGDPVIEVRDLADNLLGESEWHMSCSDADMNAFDDNDAQPQVSDLGQDCGKFQGNAKENDPDKQGGLVNDWLLAGLVDDKDKALICTEPEPGPFADSCTFEQRLVSCETYGKPDAFTFLYLGEGPVADCTDNAATRADDKQPVCEGNLPVGATVMISANADLSKTTVAPGETFELSGFGSQTAITLTGGGGTEVDDFHTSCSAPLEIGDVFGNLKLLGFDDQRGSAKVTYRYEVTNNGDPVTAIGVTDDKIGPIGTIDALGTGGTGSLEAVAEIFETTTNTATAVGTLANGETCAAPLASLTVTAVAPTCDVSIELYKIDDDKIKWKLNSGNEIDATIDIVTVSWPGDGKLEKVKFDGSDILKDVLLTSSATIDEWQKDVKDRTLEAGDTGKKLELEFDAKFPRKKDQPASDFDLEVIFEQGCSVTF